MHALPKCHRIFQTFPCCCERVWLRPSPAAFIICECQTPENVQCNFTDIFSCRVHVWKQLWSHTRILQYTSLTDRNVDQTNGESLCSQPSVWRQCEKWKSCVRLKVIPVWSVWHIYSRSSRPLTFFSVQHFVLKQQLFRFEETHWSEYELVSGFLSALSLWVLIAFCRPGVQSVILGPKYPQWRKKNTCPPFSVIKWCFIDPCREMSLLLVRGVREHSPAAGTISAVT